MKGQCERDFSHSTILVTGGAGFIGSNFIHYLKGLHPNCNIVNFDKLTYAGNLENLDGLKDNPHYNFIRGDISSKEDVENLFDRYKFDCVVNFAAETHVDRSIHDVTPFIKTNIAGAVNLMEAANNKWNGSNGAKLFIHISTDEVYGSLGETGKFTEATPISPKNPYSSSKAAADMMVISFVNTHNFPAIITRCSNNYGVYQFPEKLIPLTIINILNRKSIPLYGDGRHVRDWIFVADHCDGIESVMRRGKLGEIYNFGGAAEIYNIDLVTSLCDLCDAKGVSDNARSLITHVTDRPGHDRRYAMDISKARDELGWNPRHTTKEALNHTVDWYIENKTWWTRLLNRDYDKYYARQYGDQV